MQQVAQSFTFIEPDEPEIITVETNLYELIEAIIEETEPKEDRLVPLILSDLLNNSQIRPLGLIDVN